MADWFYDINGQASAPVTKATLGQLLASGQINRQTQVIRDGIQWMPLGDVAELQDILPAPAQSYTQPKETTVGSTYENAMSLYNAGRCAEAAPLLEKLKDSYFPDALYALGTCYEEGKGIRQSDLLAHSAYDRAANIFKDRGAKQKYAEAQKAAKRTWKKA